MEWKLEVVVLPAADIDRSKRFYSAQLGFNVDVDNVMGENFRVVQLTPHSYKGVFDRSGNDYYNSYTNNFTGQYGGSWSCSLTKSWKKSLAFSLQAWCGSGTYGGK